MKFKQYLVWIVTLCLTFPFKIVWEFCNIGKRGPITWGKWFFIYLVIASALTIIYIISSILRFKRRGFEIELYEYTNIAYEDFLCLIGDERRNCELEYREYAIRIEAQKDGYLCGIYGKSGLVSQQKFETLQELIEAKIISSQALEEIWNEVEFQNVSGIVKNS